MTKKMSDGSETSEEEEEKTDLEQMVLSWLAFKNQQCKELYSDEEDQRLSLIKKCRPLFASIKDTVEP
jgi:uncharacterized protein YecT (DUF1311 family)